MDRCSDCEHCQGSYCDVWEQHVDPDKRACPEFEER